MGLRDGAEAMLGPGVKHWGLDQASGFPSVQMLTSDVNI